MAPQVPVILDAKRGDIGATAEQYAREAFERYRADALTLSPFMGFDSLEPYLRHPGKGLFLLCRTSNPGGSDLQAQRLASGDRLFEHIARLAAGPWNASGSLGLVVGATFPDEIARVRELAPALPLLIPGVGAQGGDAEATVRAGRRPARADRRQLVARGAVRIGRRRFSGRRPARRAGHARSAPGGRGSRLSRPAGRVAAAVRAAGAPVVKASTRQGYSYLAARTAAQRPAHTAAVNPQLPALRRWLAAAAAVCAAGALALGLVPALDAALSLALAGALLLGLGLGAGVLRHRARAERYLGASREREERFLSLLGIAADAYWELDAQYRLALLSRRDRDGVFVAVTLDTVCEPWEMPHLLFDDETLDELRADLEARLPFRDVALRAVTPSGAVLHLTASGEPRFDSRGAFVGYWGVARDITEHERARGALHASEDAVRRSQALLSHLVATSPDVITLSDVATGRYAMVNDTFARLTGYTQAEVMGRTSTELGIWDRAEDRERLVSELREHGTVKDMPTEFVGKWGQRLAMRVSAARFAMDGDAYLVINARDVTGTEHVRLEREAILENASIGIALTRDQRFQVANPTFEQMFGWAPGTLVGQSGREVWTSDDDYAASAATSARSWRAATRSSSRTSWPGATAPPSCAACSRARSIPRTRAAAARSGSRKT